MNRVPAPAPSNRTVVDTYDRLASLYDWFVTPLEAGTSARALKLLGLRGGERVIEIGCGPGRALTALAELSGPDGEVLGIDAAAGMAERAHRRISGRKHVRAAVARADARSLPIADGVADVAFVEDTLELFAGEEMAAVVSELHRILRPGGRLCVVTMERSHAEATAFVRGYDWAFEHVPGFERFGCRPVYAVEALAAGGFDIQLRERHRRWNVWPVDVIIATAE
ncbi:MULTISPECIES: class I SAM-dependent methyltransferase [Salinibaculum]|uniref:class I SAM-dependent methyltransferase n=1 Tax=Salinibaculum TaxID=2732368 RepID=UPI0030D119E5